ncbi:LodA/GoxA family CTQ-dependent oxidase [Acinetobacter silvestris]|uniref:L-lysine 6-oxidase n=1 Tax=Acinetobacter silvestris TaxID=1977882 RepID=A0A1Y3CCM2_9GAMM|nr:LodA/GoxA family CTQ-dependent oxidase [Acinetobacter silvestris]OTG64838.1 hypothetical protein B9T28_11570 [Acinetobacter silvestris]
MKKYVIYPAIGIARVGNAPAEENDFFYGPSLSPALTDATNKNIDFNTFTFKNKKGQIKKQAAKFQIYELDTKTQLFKKITLDEKIIEKIEWTVHLANQKAAWFDFSNAQDLNALALPQTLRNEAISRQSLVADAKEQTLSTKNKTERKQCNAQVFQQNLHLGEIRLNEQGELIVLGGDGHAYSNGSPITTFANNDGWIDDISDGTVRARIYLKNGKDIEAEPAHVVVTPPNYGQGLNGIVTMYDVIQDLFERENIIQPEQTNFDQHIYPILKNLGNMQWINQGFHLAFGVNSEFDLSDQQFLSSLNDKNYDKNIKQKIFNLFRDPESTEIELAKNPQLYGDSFGDFDYFANQSLSITPTQYKHLKNWSSNNYSHKKQTNKFDHLSEPLQLTCYNLDSCLGGPFHPGIELTWNLRNLIMWNVAKSSTPKNQPKLPIQSVDPYRLNTAPKGTALFVNYQTTMSQEILLHPQGPLSRTEPGALTRYLGVPWHTDEASCLSGYDISQYLPMPSYWGPRVPNQVLSYESANFYLQAKGQSKEPTLDTQKLSRFADKFYNLRQDFYRTFNPNHLSRLNNMVQQWDKLGIVAPFVSNAETLYFEREKANLAYDASMQNILQANSSYLKDQAIPDTITSPMLQGSKTAYLEKGIPTLPSRVLGRDEK